MAFPKKPNHLKVLTGSRQPLDAPGVELPIVEGIPAPPDWLSNGQAVKEWKRLAPILISANLLSEASLTQFGVYCCCVGRLLQMNAAGLPIQASLVAQIRALGNDFGLSSLGAQKLKPIDDPKKGNKFGKFKRESP